MDTKLEYQHRLVLEHLTLENEHRWEDVVSTFSSVGAWFDLVPLGMTLAGRNGIEAAYNILSTALPDVHIQLVNQIDVVGCSVCEIVVTGTHTGPYLEIEPSGNAIYLEMACFFVFNAEGELVAERVYFDNANLMTQMRSESNSKFRSEI